MRVGMWIFDFDTSCEARAAALRKPSDDHESIDGRNEVSKRAVIVVDIQEEYFADGLLPLVDVQSAADAAAKLIAHARRRGDAIVYIQHEFPDPDIPFFKPGSAGVEINATVRPQPGDAILVKNHPNSFRDTDLLQLLHDEEVSSLVIVGSMTHMCIDATARAAVDLGYPVTVAHDACATRDLEFAGTVVPAKQVHSAFMAALAFAYAKVQSVEEFIEEDNS